MNLPRDPRRDLSSPSTWRGANHATDLTIEQRGLIVAALTAFFGIAYGGPVLTRLLRGPTPRERLARHIHATRQVAERKAARAGKRLRRLGGGRLRG